VTTRSQASSPRTGTTGLAAEMTTPGEWAITTLHERVRWVFEHMPDALDTLLDAGCHDGASTNLLAAKVRRAVGIDLNVTALQSGENRCGNVWLTGASVAALPFGSATFDCVVFSEVLEHLPPALEEPCISEIRRVLRPGGTLILTTPHRGTFWWLDPLMAKPHLRRLMAALRGGTDPEKGHKHYRTGEVLDLLSPHFNVEHIERTGQLLYPLAYWGHLLPMGIGQSPVLVQLWQSMMDYDYARECGHGAYNLCVMARAK